MFRMIRTIAVVMFVIMPSFSAEPLLAAVENTSWGQTKVQFADTQPQPAGKMVTSRAVAGNRNLQGRSDTFHPRYSAGLHVEVLDTQSLDAAADASNAGDDGAQAFVPFLRLRFSAGGSGVTVRELKFKRSGFSSDRSVSGLYLYQGEDIANNLLAEARSFHDRIATFNNAHGLFTVPAEGYVDIVLRGGIVDDVGAGTTISFGIASSDGIVAEGAVAAGAFPLEGPVVRTATVSDLGYVTVANVFPVWTATVDPGTNDFLGWRFSLSATDQDMEVRFLRVVNTGSAQSSDIGNFRLVVDGVVVAEVADMNDDGALTFVLARPLILLEGRTINADLLVDVGAGASGTMHFQLQGSTDVVVYDRYYEVYTKANKWDIWVVIESNSPTTYTIIGDAHPEELPQAGRLTIELAPDSPSGSIMSGARNAVLARFLATAEGEDIGIKSLLVTAPSVLNGINNVRVYYNGIQVGATSDIDSMNDDAEFYFGIGGDFAVRDGNPGVIEIRGDIKNAAGTNFSSGDEVNVSLAVGSSNAYGLTSRRAVSTSHVNGSTQAVVN